MKNNQSGFVNILVLAMLPFLIGVVLFAYSLHGWTSTQSELFYTCRKEQIQTLEKIRTHLNSLLKLNPIAKTLKIQLTTTQALLVAAIAQGNAPAVVALTKQIKIIEMRRKALDIQQKLLIQTSNIELNTSSARLYKNLKNIASTKQKALQLFENASANVQWPQLTKLQVEPEYPDVAPSYRPVPYFSERQKLVQKWQLFIKQKDTNINFLSGQNSYEKICTSTLVEKDSEWVIITKEDKSLLKP